MRTGEVARQAGVRIDTIHFYERRGLLPRPPRTSANYRAYPADTVERIRFIRHAQDLGFTLREILELLALKTNSRARCADVYRRAEKKVLDIDRRLAALRRIRRTLAGLMTQCERREPVRRCPIIAALAH